MIRLRGVLYAALLCAGVAALTSGASAQSQRGIEQRTKFGVGAQHPMVGPMDPKDPLAMSDKAKYQRLKSMPEKSHKPDENSVGNNKKTTEEHEFDVGDKKPKLTGKSGIDRGGPKDKDFSDKGVGFGGEQRPEDPPGQARTALYDFTVASLYGNNDAAPSLFAAIDPLGSLIGADNRFRITPTTYYPYRTMCKLRMHFPNGAEYIGSGTMVTPKHCLTAGHCVYSSGDGGWASWIEVIPGYDNGYKPFGSAWATYYRTYTGWTVYGSPDHDFSLITLDRRIGDTVGWMGYGYWSSLMGSWSHTGGYPGDRDYGLNLYYNSGYIMYQTSYRTFYQMDTFGGQSGSAVDWYPGGYGPYVNTVHAYGATTINGQPMNGGTRLDYSKFNSIQGWRSVDGA